MLRLAKEERACLPRMPDPYAVVADRNCVRAGHMISAGAYIGAISNYFADVSGDGKADAIVVNWDGIAVRDSHGGNDVPQSL